MADAPIHQIAFMLQFNQDFTSQKPQFSIGDSNNFLMSASRLAQLETYSSNVTPPLLNFSVSGQQLFFNISEGQVRGGVQAVVWSTFTAGSDTLIVDAQFSTGLILCTYKVLDTGAGGQLVSGSNTIKAG